MEEKDIFGTFDLSAFGIEPSENTTKEQNEEQEPEYIIHVSKRYGHRQISRKLRSEAALEKVLDWHFKPGDCYHCFSFGDVDSLTFLKHVLKQQRIRYLALSTWCMAGEDVDDLRAWHKRGMIGRIDFYLGEIFQGSYAPIYEKLVDLCEETGGRIVIFRNHSKVMIVQGERFDCLIESSANVNTNPRSENTVLTVDKELVEDYINLFNGIKSFNRQFDHVKPYSWKE